jgi:hypothetical protein
MFAFSREMLYNAEDHNINRGSVEYQQKKVNRCAV